MDRDEDEDVIFEGSQLHAHLTSVKYDGPEIDFYATNRRNSASEGHQTAEKWLVLKTLGRLTDKFGMSFDASAHELPCEVFREIIKSNLITVEDSDFLLNISDEKFDQISPINRPEAHLSITTVGALGLSAVLILTPSVPWIFWFPSLLYTGVNLFYECVTKWRDRRHRQLMELSNNFENMLSSLQSLYGTISKAVQYVQEMELIDRGFTLPNLISHLSTKTIPDQPSALLCLPLREKLLEVVSLLHNLGRVQTLKIRRAIPLDGVMDCPSHYLACQAFPSRDESQTPTLRQIRASVRQCVQQLSEMLRRLALCCLETSTQRSRNLWLLVETMNREVSEEIAGLTDQLQSAFEYYTAWKVNEKEEAPGQPLDGLQVALESLERHLRAAALISHELRCAGPAGLIKLNHECRAISTCYELIETELFKKAEGPSIPTKEAQPPLPVRAVDHAPEDREILPLYGSWEPDVVDEILEADLQGQGQLESDSDDSWMVSREEFLAGKKERAAQSRRLYCELQQVLKSKADEWKEREARVMERLGKKVEPDDPPMPENPNPPDAQPAEIKKFDAERAALCATPSTFGLQAALAAQVRAMASQRTHLPADDIFADSSDEEG